MASKILLFKRPETAPETRAPLAPATPAERLEALPEWLQDIDVAWIFDAADQRLNRNR